MAKIIDSSNWTIDEIHNEVWVDAMIFGDDGDMVIGIRDTLDYSAITIAKEILAALKKVKHG